MIEVEWKYKGNPHDRLLVMLPPLSALYVNPLLKNTDLLHHYRKTINNLCANENLKYIIVYVPFFDPCNYDQRCLFELFYGRELRLIPRLDKLLDRDYPEHLTNECVYMLRDPEEWNHTTLPVEWFFDTVICDQVYEYYDTASRWLNIDLKKYADQSVGASWVYETVLAKLELLCEDSVISVEDKDLVFVYGDIDPEEQPMYLRLIRSLIGHHQVSGLYSYGNMSPLLEEFKDEPEIKCTLCSHMTPERYDALTNSLTQYNASYTNVLWLGTFAVVGRTSDDDPVELKPKTIHGFIYAPSAWMSLFPNAITGDAVEKEKTKKDNGTNLIALLTGTLQTTNGAHDKNNRAPVFTYEPLGLLDFFLKESN